MRIVLVVLSTFQEYVLQNIVHLKQNGNHDIVVITDQKFLDNFPKYVHTIAIEDLIDNYSLMAETYGKEFRNGFWHWTSFRFYAILAYMKKYPGHILHLENDVMLFENADNIPFHDTSKILLTMDNNYRCIPGIMYIPNHTVLEQCLNQFDHSQKDMQNWGRIAQEHKKLIDTLPIAPPFTNQSLSIHLTNNFSRYNHAIFDAAAMGQYLGGIDPRNTQKPDTKGYVNTESEINYSHFEFVWLYNEYNCKSPHIIIPDPDNKPITMKIYNLHVHSKDLTQFMTYSSNNNSASKISGELIQSCCDIYLTSSMKDFTNPYINNMSDFASKCATLDDEHVIYKIKNAKTIFIFTHLLKTHMSQLTDVLKEMCSNFILVCHNSDESFSKKYEIALFESCPKLTKVYTQNLVFSPTEKTRPLPIGIANRMWTHGDMEAWSCIPTKKTHLLYYYCDLNTNKTIREDMFQVLKKKGIRMQPRVSYREYVQILQSCEFAICPEGNGVDTHRFWECLYAKTVPVCIRNPLVEYYSQFFPVLLLKSWEEFDMVSLKYKESDFYNERMLQMDFYRKQIHQISTKYCVSFATENMNDSLNRITTQLYHTKEFDAMVILRPKIFQEQIKHRVFWETHKKFILSNPDKGYGYWIWKPYLIKHVFDNMMNDWDLLLWSDAGCEINLLQPKTFDELWKTTYADKIVGSFNRPEIEWTKRDVFIFLEMDQNKEAYDTNQHQASAISFCKTPITSNMVNTWFQTCTHYNLLDDSPSQHTKRGPFRQHRHDQSIFSLLTKKFKVYSRKSIEDISPLVINRNRGANSSIQIGQWNKFMYIMTPCTTAYLGQQPECITDGGLTFAISRDNQLERLTPYILNGDEYKYTNGNGLPNIIDGLGGAPKLEPDHKIFSIIRNPYEMLYLLYKNQFGSSGEHGQSIKYIKTFEEFIGKYCETDWPYPGGFPCPYLKLSLNQQLLDHHNKCIAHVILFHEELEKGLAILKERNSKINIHKIIATKQPTSDYKKHYNEKMISQVRNKCAKELELYNYSFHGHHGTPVYTPQPIPPTNMSYTKTTDTNGRLCNQIIRNLAVSAIAKKHNLFVEYSNFDLITSLGIPLFVGERINKGVIQLNDANFFTMLNIPDGILEVNLDAMSSYFQTREISLYLYNYLQSIKNKIMDKNQYKDRYQKNNDCFVHIRLGDMAKTNPGLAYYENCLKECDKIFISSDEPEHEIVKTLLSKYPHASLFNATEKSTIQFGSTCKYVVLSQGSFSAFIGWISFFSEVYVPKTNIGKNVWYGDMFSIPGLTMK